MGHSHAANLQQFMRDNEEYDNFALPNSQVSLNFYTKRGMRIDGLLSPSAISALQDFEPSAIILLIGDNDFRSIASPHDICTKLVDAANALFDLSPSTASLVLHQMLPRHFSSSKPQWWDDTYNDRAHEFHQIFLHSLATHSFANADKVRLFRSDFRLPADNYTRYCNDKDKYFAEDGVHLNNC